LAPRNASRGAGRQPKAFPGHRTPWCPAEKCARQCPRSRATPTPLRLSLPFVGLGVRISRAQRQRPHRPNCEPVGWTTLSR